MSKVYEWRQLTGKPGRVEVRAEGDGEEAKKRIRGHAAVTGQMQEIFPGFLEVIQRGAFEEAIKRDDVRALWNHDSNIVLGRNAAGTLELEEDDEGLVYVIDPPDTQLVRDMVLSPIERGDVTGSSFGFHVGRATEDCQADGAVLRTIESFDALVDVSPVTFPAYPDATVAIRSWLETKPEAEAGEWLRRNLDLDLTYKEVGSLLRGDMIPRPGGRKAPTSTPSLGFDLAIRRRRLDLARAEAES